MSTTAQTHLIAYPFPASGHLIPLLDLSKNLVSRGVNVTVLVTPSTQHLVPTNYSPLLETLLLPSPQLPIPKPNQKFQKGLVDIVSFMRQAHYPIIMEWAKAHTSPPSAIISDFFLGWTQNLARELHVPRIAFSPSAAFTVSLFCSLWRFLPQNDNPEDPDSVISFPNLPNSPVYPWWQISRMFRDNRGEEDWEMMKNDFLLNLKAWGVVFNSFVDLEQPYLDHVKKEMGHERVWAVGPILPLESDKAGLENRGGSSTVSCDEITTWLDSREEGSVVYVCFGSLTIITNEQMDVLTRGLELSGVQFVLSVRVPDEGHVAQEGKIPSGFIDRVRGRGLVIQGWSPQLVIQSHQAVGAFLTHCGWNSVMEGIVSGLIMLTWPMGADQYTNAKLLVDQLGVGVRAAEGTKNIPEADELAKRIVSSLSLGGKINKERLRAKELRDAAFCAINKDGSSHKNLDALLNELKQFKQ